MCFRMFGARLDKKSSCRRMLNSWRWNSTCFLWRDKWSQWKRWTVLCCCPGHQQVVITTSSPLPPDLWQKEHLLLCNLHVLHRVHVKNCGRFFFSSLEALDGWSMLSLYPSFICIHEFIPPPFFVGLKSKANKIHSRSQRFEKNKRR